MYIEAKESAWRNAVKRSARVVFGLLPTLVFAVAVFLRNVLYRFGLLPVHRLPFKVISVGNLSVGGTGKTPTAELILRECQQRGLRAAYLSRGYGRGTKGFVRVLANNTTAYEAGDEALQVANKFPTVAVAVCEDRVAGARELHRQIEFDVLVLDDAFQHRRIGRDLDIVTLDATRLPWKDWLLPLGRLREPVSSLRRAQLVLVNKVIDPNETRAIRKRLKKAKMAFTKVITEGVVPFDPALPRLTATDLHHQTVVAFSALGNNRAFLNHLLLHGANVARFYSYVDHHRYRPEEVKRMLRRYHKVNDKAVTIKAPIIITTEKDYTRLHTEPWFAEMAAGVPFYYVAIGMEVIKGNEAFSEALDAVLPANSKFNTFAPQVKPVAVK